MSRRYRRIALLAGVPHWVIARSLPVWKRDQQAESALAKVYGR